MYYQLIETCTEDVRLATAIVKNADYKPCIKEATDPLIADAVKDAYRLQRLLQELLNRQEYANAMHTPPCGTQR